MRIAIIPARAGSKRIPGKNGRLFAGLPLLAYPIRACIKTVLFDHILVSTDSPEFADLARDHGAEAPFLRPAELADDFASTQVVNNHALAWAEEHWGKVDQYCQLYANPFISSSSIVKGYELLMKSDASEVLAICEFQSSPLRALKLDERNSVEYMFPEYENMRSQDLTSLYFSAAQFYWHDVEKKKNEKRHFALPVIRPAHLVVDIDTEADWIRAEKLYANFKNELD